MSRHRGAIAGLAALALVISSADAQPAPPGITPYATPLPAGPATPLPIATPQLPTVATPPAEAPSPAASAGATPTGATPTGAASSTPQHNFISYTAQLLDVRDNNVYFTTGDVFPIIDAPRIVDYFTGLPTTKQPMAKMFARATFDPQTKKIIELAVTDKRVPTSSSEEPVEAFAIPPTKGPVAPELVGQNVTGKQVAVVFEVTAPPTTNLTDTLYISTDASNWNPQAIRLDRVDAYLYRAERYFASGTKFAYRVTRGSWNSVERGEDNLDSPPHQFFVREVDSLAARVTVYHWSDENPSSQSAGPTVIPTPYNSNPFAGGPGGISVPQIPTPVPTPVR